MAMNLKEEIIMLEKNFQANLQEAMDGSMKTITKIVPPSYGDDSKSYEDQSFEEKTATLSNMFRAGRYLRKTIVDNDDGKGGKLFSTEVKNKLEIRIMNGFKQLYKLIDALTKDIKDEEDTASTDMRAVIKSNNKEIRSRNDMVTEAYFSPEQKKAITPEITKLIKKFGVKGTLSIKDHNTIVLTVSRGDIDFASAYTGKYDGYIQLSMHRVDKAFTKGSDAYKFVNEAMEILQTGYYNNSDSQIDYFDTSHYAYIYIGKYDIPYVFTGTPAKSKEKVIPKSGVPSIADKFGELSEYVDDDNRDTFLKVINHVVSDNNQYIALVTLLDDMDDCHDVAEFAAKLKNSAALVSELDDKLMTKLINIAKEL
jgi:hypothetical protein